MAKYTDDYVLDGAASRIATANLLVITEGQPANFIDASDPAAWAASTAYALGDVRRPTTRNGFVYEVTTAGTSAATEPAWPTTLGATVTDGTVVWTCRANATLGSIAVDGTDFTLADGDVSGRKVTIAAQTGIAITLSGTANHVAVIDTVNKRLLHVTTMPGQAVTAGNTANTAAWDAEFADVTP